MAPEIVQYYDSETLIGGFDEGLALPHRWSQIISGLIFYFQ